MRPQGNRVWASDIGVHVADESYSLVAANMIYGCRVGAQVWSG